MIQNEDMKPAMLRRVGYQPTPKAEFMSFLGIILRVLKLEVSVYNVYITNQYQITFAQARGE
jgi:hypothetical protein